MFNIKPTKIQFYLNFSVFSVRAFFFKKKPLVPKICYKNKKGKACAKEVSDVKRNQPATGLHASHQAHQRPNEHYKEISSSIDESSPTRVPPTVTKPLSVDPFFLLILYILLFYFIYEFIHYEYWESRFVEQKWSFELYIMNWSGGWEREIGIYIFIEISTITFSKTQWADKILLKT